MDESEISKKPEEPKNNFEPIDFMIFKDEIQDDFATLTKKLPPSNKEKRALVIGKYILPKFNYIFSMQNITDLGFGKIYLLENCPQKIEEFEIVFVIPSKIECIEIVVKQILKDQKDIHEKQKNSKKTRKA